MNTYTESCVPKIWAEVRFDADSFFAKLFSVSSLFSQSSAAYDNFKRLLSLETTSADIPRWTQISLDLVIGNMCTCKFCIIDSHSWDDRMFATRILPGMTINAQQPFVYKTCRKSPKFYNQRQNFYLKT